MHSKDARLQQLKMTIILIKILKNDFYLEAESTEACRTTAQERFRKDSGRYDEQGGDRGQHHRRPLKGMSSRENP
jgi:hypothetical protein